MEAIIRTNDTNLFNSLLLFLKNLHITVEAKKDEVLLSKSGEQVAAMKKLRGSGSGNLLSALLDERAKDKNR